MTRGRAEYVIVDLPIFIALQWLYLASVLGPEHVHIVDGGSDPRRGAGIVLVPLALAHDVEPGADLFISTWALSKCTTAAQDFVVDRDWFQAERLLLAYQRSTATFPDAERGSGGWRR